MSGWQRAGGRVHGRPQWKVRKSGELFVLTHRDTGEKVCVLRHEGVWHSVGCDGMEAMDADVLAGDALKIAVDRYEARRGAKE